MFTDDLGMNGGSVATWSRHQDKVFERALVVFPEETPDRWERISGQVPGKTPSEVRRHYEDLVHDVCEIDSGRVEPPNYGDESSASPENGASSSFAAKQAETERKKGVPWTEEEHRLFLIGLQKYGKGDWRSISRNAVVTRTPTQVASHAQKYFLRLNSGKKDKKRSSIHDITAAVDGSSSATAAATSADARELGPFDDLGPSVMDSIDVLEYSHSRGGLSQYQPFGFPM